MRVLVATMALVFAAHAEAALIYGSAATNGSGPLTIYNTASNSTSILNASAPGNMALSFDGSGNLWGLKWITSTTSNLYSINTGTGAVSLVGTGTYNSAVEGLTIDVNGRLIAGTSGGPPRLYSVNSANGISTSLGTVTGMSDIDGLTVAPVAVATNAGVAAAGTFFAVDSGRLYTINPTTLAATFLHNVPASESIAFGSDGTLYGNGASGYSSINPLSGASTLLGGPQVWGSAVASEVPEPGTLAIWGLLGLGGAFVGYRRRRKAVA